MGGFGRVSKQLESKIVQCICLPPTAEGFRILLAGAPSQCLYVPVPIAIPSICSYTCFPLDYVPLGGGVV